MEEESLQASYDLFGLSYGAGMVEVEKAFRELRNLYSGESLATYSLFDEADRQEKLESLRAAYERILQSHYHPPKAVEDNEKKAEPVTVESQKIRKVHKVRIDTDLQQMPGLFLQQSRKAQGLSLQDVAERTKIRSSFLQSIEEQRFDFLPAPVYLRGFLREFARMVNVPDADALVEAFMTLYASDR